VRTRRLTTADVSMGDDSVLSGDLTVERIKVAWLILLLNKVEMLMKLSTMVRIAAAR
jgi:hypothetical protein